MSDRGAGAAGRRRPRLTILVKLVFAFVLPATLVFTLFGAIAHEVARRDLEAELGRRLAAIAATASRQVRGKYLTNLSRECEAQAARKQLSPECDVEWRGYLNARRVLLALKQVTGVARIYIFDRAFRSKVDTADNVPINSTYFRAELHRAEIARVFERAESVASVWFRGDDGRYYHSGYGPVVGSPFTDETVVLAIGVDAPATYFERLAELRRKLFFYGAILVLVMLGIAIVLATFLTRPVRKLAGAAERIGKGELDAPIARTSRDEIGFLAETMEEMRVDLRARDQRMQLMLSGIAHEVRNPLGGIELFAGILAEELPADDERSKHVARINKELSYLKLVVEDFLDYARRPKPQLGVQRLDELVAEVVELERGEASAAGTTLACELSEASCEGDPGQLRRVVLNLLRNAIQASAGIDEPVVHIRVRGGTRAVLEIANRGTAIPPDVLEHIFEPFYTTREKGTGLGLAFVAEIVADHRAEVSVTSTERDGTTFTITFPRVSPVQMPVH